LLAALPTRFLVQAADHDGPRAPRFDESLIELATASITTDAAASAGSDGFAAVWQAEQGLVVPRTYQHHENFLPACKEFAQAGWPVTVRQSGGGIVPQGPGILNLSIAYGVRGRPLDHSNAAYELICVLIQNALKEHGIPSRMQAVEGSFCDGRYNLAVGPADDSKKVAGTAQVWRRIRNENAQPEMKERLSDVQVVLVHALILAQVDIHAVTRQANRFELAVGSGRRYDAHRTMSLHHCLAAPVSGSGNFTETLRRSLLRQLGASASPQR
jgi:hypothetical protein